MTDNNDNDEVGYGNPPKATRFKPGQSGNPRGRPKGSKTLDQILRKELASKVTIREGNKAKKVTKKEALVKRLFKDAADGKPAAQRQLFALMQSEEAQDETSKVTKALSPTEQALFDEFVVKLGDQNDLQQ